MSTVASPTTYGAGAIQQGYGFERPTEETTSRRATSSETDQESTARVRAQAAETEQKQEEAAQSEQAPQEAAAASEVPGQDVGGYLDTVI